MYTQKSASWMLAALLTIPAAFAPTAFAQITNGGQLIAQPPNGTIRAPEAR